jgi:hypothetical protein
LQRPGPVEFALHDGQLQHDGNDSAIVGSEGGFAGRGPAPLPIGFEPGDLAEAMITRLRDQRGETGRQRA